MAGFELQHRHYNCSIRGLPLDHRCGWLPPMLSRESVLKFVPEGLCYLMGSSALCTIYENELVKC